MSYEFQMSSADLESKNIRKFPVVSPFGVIDETYISYALSRGSRVPLVELEESLADFSICLPRKMGSLASL